MAETWRRVPVSRILGVPAGYEASDENRVRSVPRILRGGRAAGSVVLKPWLDKNDYLTVQLGRRKVHVHVAVALAWHGRPEVRHLNGDQQDNRPGNLAWGSRLENERDKRRGKEDERDRREGKEKLNRNGTCPVENKTPFKTRLIRLSDAVSQGIVSCSLHAIRKAAQRDPLFPAHKGVRGLAKLYDAAELYAWDQSRIGRYS